MFTGKEIKNDAQVTVIVKGFSLSFKKTFNFCSILPNDESCPLTEGRHVFAYRKLLPFYVPKVKIKVTMARIVTKILFFLAEYVQGLCERR